MDPTNESSGSRCDLRGKNLERDNSDKGKEKEQDVGIRDVEREQVLALNMESEGVEDDDDYYSDGGVHRNLTSGSSALQGPLRKLDAGLDYLLPATAMGGSASSSHQSGRLKKILAGLRADGEEGRQLEALSQLCDMLSIGTEESLSTFSVDSFVPVLVGLLNHESNPDVMLLAARALTHLCDVLPSSCAAVVHYGAVSIFCARLLTIEYMDFAEQSLQALKKISQEHPTACLRAGALMAVLSYLDFFSTGVQRVALSTAANMCKKLPPDAADFVMEAVPLLTNLLQYHDSKVLEHASVCLTRIVEAFASSPDKLDELCNHGLVTQAASLISTSSSAGGQASLSTPTYTGLIRLLSTFASGSPLGAKTLLLLGISGILKDILSGSGVSSINPVSPALSRPADQIFEIVNLANELLPPLPQGTISLPVSSNLLVKGYFVKKCPSGSSGQEDTTNGNVHEISAREKLLNDQPELLQQFGMDLLPVLMQIYGASVNDPVRHKCLSVIGKLMYFSTAEMIQSLLSVTNISRYLELQLGCCCSMLHPISEDSLQLLFQASNSSNLEKSLEILIHNAKSDSGRLELASKRILPAVLNIVQSLAQASYHHRHHHHHNQTLSLCFKLLRNLCAGEAANQVSFIELNGVAVVWSVLRSEAGSSGPDHGLVRWGLQVLANVSLGGKQHQRAIWEELYPIGFASLARVGTKETCDPLCMVIYTCCDGNPEWFKKLSSDDGWPVMAEIVRTASSASFGEDWLKLLLSRIFLEESQLPVLFSKLQFVDVPKGEVIESKNGQFSFEQAFLLQILSEILNERLGDVTVSKDVALFVFGIFKKSIGVLEHSMRGKYGLPSGYAGVDVLGYSLTILRDICAQDGMRDNTKDVIDVLLSYGLIELLLSLLGALEPPAIIRKGLKQIENQDSANCYSKPCPYKGFRRDIVALIGNCVYRRKHAQDEIRDRNGILLLLQQCVTDEDNPFLREWGIWCVRNMLEGNDENQKVVAELEIQGSADVPEINALGLRVEVDQRTRRAKLVNIPSCEKSL